MKTRSLYGRLIVGAAIWSAGLLVAAVAIGMIAVNRYPEQVLIVHHGLLALTGAVLVTAGISVLRRGMSPLTLLEERLRAVREGRSSRLEGEYPTEVVPLVDGLNDLLSEREVRVAKAVARAGDLAHGLKTPLAILTQEVERADAAGHHDLATEMRQQIVRMRRQIDAHLAHARVSAAGVRPDARVVVLEGVQGLVRAMARLYAARSLDISVDVNPAFIARMPLEDLEEILGNFLDNACKWAGSRVHVSSAIVDSRLLIHVDDDGGGLRPEMREQVLKRGVRADESAPGTGLGLAIARDVAEAYGGAVSLDQSPLGGLRSTLALRAWVAEDPG